MQFITHNSQFLGAPFAEITRAASPFMQSDCFDTEKNNGYLFIEFWSSKEKHRPFVVELLKKLRP